MKEGNDSTDCFSAIGSFVPYQIKKIEQNGKKIEKVFLGSKWEKNTPEFNFNDFVKENYTNVNDSLCNLAWIYIVIKGILLAMTLIQMKFKANKGKISKIVNNLQAAGPFI